MVIRAAARAVGPSHHDDRDHCLGAGLRAHVGHPWQRHLGPGRPRRRAVPGPVIWVTGHGSWSKGAECLIRVLLYIKKDLLSGFMISAWTEIGGALALRGKHVGCVWRPYSVYYMGGV